ncbi:GNAT family N-acetyltransferase [Sphingomonas sp. ST-64]|uniref:GNAT family N-acetyltransferase n=1 Tax=Sphingomonas plantiphila TaxID=3163295 RepID=A0ABW8YHQ4_9SPHN
MTEPIQDCAGAFDRAFVARAPNLTCRPQRRDDAEFLTDLFVACSPMAGMLPDPLLRHQALIQRVAHDTAHPEAMQRIAELEGRPIGRFMIAWRSAESHGVDLAVMPEARATGAGLYFLRAWIEVADAVRVPAVLEVAIENPALRIYRRLGFEVAEGQQTGPVVTMRRPVRRR